MTINENKQHDVTLHEEDDLSSLIINNEENKAVITETKEPKKSLFEKYKIKDIVFLAIMSACMLVTGAIMPLVGNIPVFGIIQVCLGIQFSLFPCIGMLKVGKPGSLFLMSMFCGIVLVFMNVIMFLCMLICSLIAEGLTLLIFRNENSYKSCLFASTVFFPTTLPFLYIYYKFLYTVTSETGAAVSAFIGSTGWVAFGMSIAVIAVCFVGALLGVLITKELRKAGVIKK